MNGRQNVWVGPDSTRFEASCEECLTQSNRRVGHSGRWSASLSVAAFEGTLRRDADVGFTTCRRGHRIIVRRVGRELSRPKFH
jgi:hypothetical protein